jgi:hypothetical protein
VIVRNQGNGVLGAKVDYVARSSLPVAAGDLDGDGIFDRAVAKIDSAGEGDLLRRCVVGAG